MASQNPIPTGLLVFGAVGASKLVVGVVLTSLR
jgi:hypothetical protein